MREWEKIVPEKDREIYNNAGFKGRQEWGNAPALLVIDVVESFTGPIDVYKTSAGQSAWDAMPYIKKSIDLTRNKGWKVIYIKGSAINKKYCGTSTKRQTTPDEIFETFSSSIVSEISPHENDFVLEKTKASAFFGTPLITYLNINKIDSLIVVGTSTSGCVRNSVIDAFSYGFPVFLIEEGCFDRSEFLHLVHLFDMNGKYANVVSFEDYHDFLKSV